MITVLAGGVGAARFLRGLLAVVPAADITAVVNTGDDTTLNGLRISPDLDTVTYTLAGAIDPQRGWGLVDETWQALAALERYGDVRPAGSASAPTWFRLGDRDLATHLYRTSRLAEGATLSEVTAEITAAWDLALHVVPMTDDPVATVVVVRDADGEVVALPFQEYFVRRQHAVPVVEVRIAGAEAARPTFLPVITASSQVVVAPSNPIVSIGPLRALTGVDAALATARDRVVAVSPIVAGAALKGPADRMLAELGHEPSVVGVARLYAPVASTLVIDRADEALAGRVEAEGMRCVVTDTVMSDPTVAAALARTTLEAVGWRG